MANGGLILDYILKAPGVPSAYTFPGGSAGVPSLGVNATEVGLYLNTTNNHMYAWDGAAWQDVTGAAGGGAGALTQITKIGPLVASQATAAFSSIAGTYNALMIQYVARTTSGNAVDVIQLTVNGDTATNYDWSEIIGAVSYSYAVTAGQAYARIAVAAGGTAAASTAAGGRIELPGYAGTTFYKPILGHSRRPDSNSMHINTATWKSTAAITSITLTPAAGSFDVGSMFVLYGLT